MTAAGPPPPPPPAPGRRLALTASVLSVPKSAGEPSEDAAALDLARGRIAVCDGASRALASGPWAWCLADRFVAAPPDDFGEEALACWVRAAAEEWSAGIRLPAEAPPYLSDAVARGSFATLLGVVVEAAPPGAGSVWWRAVAVGDTCLVALRAGAVVRSFPLDGPEQFTSAPALVPTSAGALPGALSTADVTSGACGVGDVLLVMTDALARWALGRAARGGEVWRFLTEVAPGDFEGEVRLLWRRGELEVDDVTLVRCGVVVGV
ncbi:hypothetical protein [Streptomyces aureoverticillatus]|uniref:hypothetical protein n=1 Tax=Streptomyces aureoverticillatus TaxID=66871 RepID=UPI0013D9B697|nr:hypothetical protein [Streptomyces aureoverticillatus]QIB47561.1 hypothetical protein G3H79_35275 [Streptomyces aureoverticillatus]